MTRRPTLPAFLLTVVACWASAQPATGQPAPAVNAQSARPNVLFIAIDDQNDWVGCLGGHPQARTPHIDALAARGTLFANAHCQAPLCNPSRASLMTGLRPSSTGIYGLAPGIRAVEVTKDRVTLPQHLRASGYWTYSCGKIYHDGSVRPRRGQGPDMRQGERKDPGTGPVEFDVWGPAPGMPKPPTKIVTSGTGPHPAMDWGVFPERDEDQADWKIADAAVGAIAAAPADKPFFVAAGFRLPHVPCYASQKWFDLFPDASLAMPPVREDDRGDTPNFSWYLHWKLPEPRLSALRKADQWRPLVRAYLASTSFMDSQVGRLIEALERSGRAENTVIVLWSDHGYHLGEKAITGKNTLWERSTRVPLVFAGPGVTAGQRVTTPAELLDIYPTLTDLLGLPPRDGLEGHSLLPQLKSASAPREHPAITTHNQGNHTVRSERWRYIRYADGSEELYDLYADPNEWTNLAKNADQADVLAAHRKWLPKVDLPPAPGSANRVLVKGDGGAWVWEGKAIDPTEREE